MDPAKQLPPLPTAPAGRASKRPESGDKLVLKPESPWATRIRELLRLKQEGAHYVPYMPVRRSRGLFKSLHGGDRSDSKDHIGRYRSAR